jgi:cell division transport system permease protein
MALKVDYVLRETGSNLRRNVTLTVASILTVAVSLALVGCALLIRQGVENATARWKGGIEFIVFLQPNASPAQTSAIQRALKQSPDIKRYTYFDQDAAYREFKDLFKNSPEMVAAVTPKILPPSFRVVPRVADADVISGLSQQFQRKPGVKEVVAAYDAVKTIQKFSDGVTLTILYVAAFLLAAATLLILNTIRMAMFARRREIEVMKLVGATNWFIRVPFMLEGMIQGIVGAAFAVGAVQLLNRYLQHISGGQDLKILQGFTVSSPEVFGTSLLVVITGCIIGALGSGVAVSRFLDV